MKLGYNSVLSPQQMELLERCIRSKHTWNFANTFNSLCKHFQKSAAWTQHTDHSGSWEWKCIHANTFSFRLAVKYQRPSLLVMLYNLIFLSHCDMVTWFSDSLPSLGEILLLGAFSVEKTRAFILPSMQSFCGVTGYPALDKMPDIPGPLYKNNCAHTVTHRVEPSSPNSLESLK